MSFENFWDFFKDKRVVNGHIVQVCNDRLVTEYTDIKYHRRRYSSRRVTAERYFEARLAGQKLDAAYFNNAYNYWNKSKNLGAGARAVTIVNKRGSTDSVEPPPAMDEVSHHAANACKCRVCVSRKFLDTLIRDYGFDLQASLQNAGWSNKWNDWVLRGAQISLARLGRGAVRLTPAQGFAILGATTAIFNAANAKTYIASKTRGIITLCAKGLTLGEAQKIINLASKYIYAMFFSEVHRGWISNHRWIHEVAVKMDLPIDRVVLKNLRVKYKAPLADAAGGITPIRAHGHGCIGAAISWSALNCPACYANIQDFCRQKGEQLGYFDPMHFEMAELWP